MINTGVQKVLTHAYVLIKLSIFFWCYAFLGLLILGIGPAFMVIAEIFNHSQWDYEKIKFREGLKLFRDRFGMGNAYGYSYLLVFILLGYNLYLSVQTKGLLFLVIDFIIIFVLFLSLSMFNFGILLYAKYSCTLIDLFKLSFVQFFNNAMDVLKLLIGYIIILVITYKLPGLILFGTIPAFIVWTSFIGRKWYIRIDEIFSR